MTHFSTLLTATGKQLTFDIFLTLEGLVFFFWN